MEPVRCYCGNPISNIYEAFVKMKSIYIEENADKKTHIDFNMLNPQENADISHIFEALGLEPHKYCCKSLLVCSVQFHDLEVQNRL